MNTYPRFECFAHISVDLQTDCFLAMSIFKMCPGQNDPKDTSRTSTKFHAFITKCT